MRPESRASNGSADSAFDFLAGTGEMAALIRGFDWSSTPLGPPARWSPSLRMMVGFLVANRFPLLLWWGPHYIQIYNDAYIPVLGAKHPKALGQPVSECWDEIWSVIGPLIDAPFSGGPATWMEDIELEIKRYGLREETHFTIAYSPVPDETAPRRIGGVLATVHEITEKVIGQRRVGILRELGARVADGKTAQQACAIAAETLAQHPKDIAFALLYLLQADGTELRRADNVGLAVDSAGPPTVRLNETAASVPWPLVQALRTGKAVTVEDLAARLPTLPPGFSADQPARAVVLPIASSVGHLPAGVLVVGVNPRVAFDAQHLAFLDLLNSQIAAAIANAHAYDAERTRAEALAEIDRAKTVFFSNVSHEFRTPLTLMLGPIAEASANPHTPAQVRDQLELAHRNAQRLLKLVNSLLDFSRIEAGRVQASFEPTDPAALTRDLASTFRSAIERAGLSFTVDCEDLGEPLYVDRDMWEKIVLNLLSNAFKFTLDGSISVRLKRAATHAVLEIEDTGLGVPAEELPRLFERFHRVEGTHGRTHEGSGIGLALVHELVKIHGGTIEAMSELAHGTTFRVAVPLGHAHLPAERLKRPRPGPSTGTGAQAFVQEALRWLPESSGDTSRRLTALADPAAPAFDRRFSATFGARIILADDNADMRAYVRDLLTPIYNVEAVGDGEQVLAAARRARPDLILSDVMMPRLDGLGLLAAVRGDESLQSVPVILLSARAGAESKIEGLDAGADDYLTKPFSARELLARIGALLELAHMRQQSEDRLRRRTAQYETLLNEAPLGVYLIGADFRVREMNPTARPVFGDIPDLIGKDFGEVIRVLWPQPYADELLARFRCTLETGRPFSMREHVEERLDRGVTEYYEWQINRISLPDGGYGVVCYFRDISAHVKARVALQAADRQKDEFLAMLAHELRNPLAPLRYASELLAGVAQQNAHTRQIVDIIKRQTAQLTRLVDDLLDVSRITQGRIELKRAPLELGAVVSEALEAVAPLLREKRHHVAVVSSYQLYVDGDNTRLVQCASNVLTNAAKYTDAGGSIRVHLHADGATACLEVADNGVGIAPDLLPHVFDLFVQSDRTLDRSQGGLGIGLSVVRRLVEMHGGEVVARSEGIGRGTTVEIRLPLTERAGTGVNAATSPSIAPQRVLIVDDNSDAANTLALLLKLDGHATEAVYASSSALERAPSFRPHIVLVDIGLPGMNGYELARALRALPGLGPLRLVAVTGYGQTEDRQRAMRAGFDDHLVKPVDTEALKRALLPTPPADGR